MCGDTDFRIRIEAAFPGARVEPVAIGGWRISLAEPLIVDGLEVRVICCWREDKLLFLRSARGVEAWGAPTSTWLAIHEEVRDRLAAVSGHRMIETRRRLGL